MSLPCAPNLFPCLSWRFHEPRSSTNHFSRPFPLQSLYECAEELRHCYSPEEYEKLLDQSPQALNKLLDAYLPFHDLNLATIDLIEPLRTLRIMHHAAWIARRWSDPAFPAAFPWFDSERYWSQHVLELREQQAALQEPPLAYLG